jgi:FkbM family methyltransferase
VIDQDFFSQFFSRGDLVFDIGANIGKWTKDALLAGAGRVIAVEMQAPYAAIIRKKYEDDPRVEVVCKAVSDNAGSLPSYECQWETVASLNQDWQNYRFKGLEWHPAAVVETVTLDDLIAEFGLPACIKLDIEGWEKHAFGALSHPVSSFIFEFVCEFVDDTAACMDKIEKLGEYEFSFNNGDGPQFAVPWMSREDCECALQAGFGNPLSWGSIYARKSTK